MTLLRFAARTMLASYFVTSGVKALRDPEALVPAAEPLIDRIVPTVKQYAPEQVSSSIPEDPVTLIRINGVLQLVGGLALATGKGRRLGALVLAATLIPATIAKHPFWTRTDRRGTRRRPRALPQEREPARRSAARLPGHRGPAVDRLPGAEGRPVAGPRHQEGQSEDRRPESGPGRGRPGRRSGAGYGAVVATSRKAKQASRQAAQGGPGHGARQLEESKKAAAAAAKQAQKDAAQAKKDAAKQAPRPRRPRGSAAKAPRTSTWARTEPAGATVARADFSSTYSRTLPDRAT